MTVLFRSYELDTSMLRVGCYVKENGYYMINDNPVYEQPVTRHYILDSDGTKYEIAPEYLSVNFEDMFDNEGAKIFASLQEDGKGGDMFYIGDKRLNYIAILRRNQLMAKQENTYGSFIGEGYAKCKNWKVIGIQK